jgi:UDP-N-acetylglucosamine 4,6-dehydratase
LFDGKSIFVTGGTGSFGNKFVEMVLAEGNPREIIVFSRDELKQSEMAQRFPPKRYPVRYFLGDIRDRERLMRAFVNVDYVVHAAALKQVPALEANPLEAVQTNIIGAENIIHAALERGVKRVVAISTDKAVNPLNLYGATKLVMEKLFIAANAYVRYRDVAFTVVRYGNVVGSRGSVVPFFRELIASGETELPITDPRMTRFWISLEEGVRLVFRALLESHGGETYIPKIPSMKITDIIDAFPGKFTTRVVGVRPGEKLHETLLNEDEARHTIDCGPHYIMLPQFPDHDKTGEAYALFPRMREGFEYRSDTNDDWLDVPRLRRLVGNNDLELAIAR